MARHFPVRTSTITKCSQNLLYIRDTEIDLGVLPDVVVYHGKQPDVQEITRVFMGILIGHCFQPSFLVQYSRDSWHMETVTLAPKPLELLKHPQDITTYFATCNMQYAPTKLTIPGFVLIRWLSLDVIQTGSINIPWTTIYT